MLHLIPRPVHIAALRVAHAVRMRWWKLSGARVSGVRVVVLDADSRVLLIRHSYGSPNWMLPGGGMKCGEDALKTAAREVLEEAGLAICDAAEIGRVTDMLHGANNDVRVVAGWSDGVPQPDGREILAAAFFALDALPPGMSAKLPPLLPGYVTAAEAARPRP